MPIYKRDGGLNSPYAASDFKTPNPNYGKISDLKNFVSVAHKLNMQVWLDWVPNHTANNHPWLKEHPEYYANDLHSFYNDVSQLNYENIGLCNTMTNILKFWIDEVDIDGYRCDFISSPYIPNKYWLSTIPELKNYKSYLLNRNSTTSPSCISYSLPSGRRAPAARAPATPLFFT